VSPPDVLRIQLKALFSGRTLQRIRILRQAARDVRATFTAPAAPTFPVPLELVHQTLVRFGIARGDVVHVHTSVSHLMRGSSERPAGPVPDVRTYAAGVLSLLLELVGPDGTITMPTDFNRPPGWLKRAVSGTEIDDDVFDPARSPSNRGLISEYLRTRSDVVRSLHPYYNVTGWGRHAADLVGEHHLSTPYTQDSHSPWYKLTKRGGKVLLIGRTFDINSLIHLVEYLHPDEYPRPLFMSRPVPMYYLDRSGSRQRIDVALHASGATNSVLFTPPALFKFAEYINQRYGIYQIRTFHDDVAIVCYDAEAQYEAFLREMRANVTWYDPRFIN
jgi:aminoglycoside N3'-acetyltransferase